MRFDVRLHGRTASGQLCHVDVALDAKSQQDLLEQAQKIAGKAAWLAAEPPFTPIPKGTTVTVERVERI
jgi:hypothetical protein